MPDPLPALDRACGGRVSPAGDSDAVLGVVPRWVVWPDTTAQVAETMRVASAHGLAVVARGTGSKLRWGNPPRRLDVVVDTTGLDALVEHAGGDLVLVTGAGRRLDTIQRDVAGAAQHLGVDPARAGTVGGAVATGSTGPMRLRHGAVRDLVIGMTFVRADGVVARSGGKVVKNVAGYDLAKLLTGSYGTLGIVTEVAFRLHPTPQARRWIDADVNSIRQAHQAVQAVVHSQLMTAAVELDWRDGKGRIAVQLEGHVDGLDATTGQLERILASDTRSSAQPPPWWGREPEPNAALLKVTHEIGALANVLEATERAQSDTAARGVLRGSPAVGTAVVAVDTPEAGRPSAGAVAAFLSLMRTQAPRFGGAVVVLDAPDEVRERLDMWGPTSGLDLMRSVKGRFDPRHILAPGRFVGGI